MEATRQHLVSELFSLLEQQPRSCCSITQTPSLCGLLHIVLWLSFIEASSWQQIAFLHLSEKLAGFLRDYGVGQSPIEPD